MTRTVTLVRHAMPKLEPGASPELWGLGEEGRAAATRLRAQLAPLVAAGAVVLSSAEAKAAETVLLATDVAPRRDPRFGEVRRPVEPFEASDRVRARRGAWVAGELDERHREWEPADAAAARFAAGLADHPGDVIVGTHGMVMTAWLVAIGEVSAGDAARETWEGLAFPHVMTVRG